MQRVLAFPGSRLRAVFARLVFGLVSAVPSAVPGVDHYWEGNGRLQPRDHSAWPSLGAVLNDESRVGFTAGSVLNTAFYRGDTLALERVLKAFAECTLTKRLVTLRPGRGELGASGITPPPLYDWHVAYSNGSSRGASLVEAFALDGYPVPVFTVYVGGNVDLERLRIPRGVTVVGIETQRKRFRRALTSPNKHVRRFALARLPGLDPYGRESRVAVLQLGEESEDRSWVQSSLSQFMSRVIDSPEARRAYARDVERIGVFVDAHGRRWLLPVLVILVVAATSALVFAVWRGRIARFGTRGGHGAALFF